MSTQPGAGLVSNTGSSPSGDPKPALDVVRRWNDGVQRHTLFTVCGTQQDGWGIYNDPGTQAGRDGLLGLVNAILHAASDPVRGVGAKTPLTQLPPDGTNGAALGVASCDAVVGNMVDKNLFNWVPVSYPASFPGAPANLDNSWQPTTISISDSIVVGTNELISLIKNTPGTFALCGMSQGAVVISQVLRAMQPGGLLANRYEDCIGAVAYGNPVRKTGAAYPGAPANTTGGLFARTTGKVTGLDSMSSLPSWWWEMSTPGDFFSDAPMAAANNLSGTVLTQIATTIGNFKGLGLDPVTQIGNIVKIILSVTGPLVNAARTPAGVTAVRELGLWLRGLGFFAFARTAPLTPNPIQSVINAVSTGFSRGLLKGLFKLTDAELADNLLAGNYPDGNPHMFYGVWKPPTLPTGLSGVNSSSSYIDVGAAYLNQRGAEIAPRGTKTRTL